MEGPFFPFGASLPAGPGLPAFFDPADKAELRLRLRAWRVGLKPEAVAAAGEAVARRLAELPEYRQARTIMAYWSVGNELPTHGLVRAALAAGKRVCLPATIAEEGRLEPRQVLDPDRDLVTGARNIPEPAAARATVIDPAEIDLILVPGMAFDRQGWRLGRGFGYYDRFFRAPHPLRACLAGLAFDAQVLPSVPRDERDMPVQIIVHESGVIRCRPNPAS